MKSNVKFAKIFAGTPSSKKKYFCPHLMLLASENSFLEKYNCPDLQLQLDEGRDLVIQEKPEGAEIIIPKNKVFEEQASAVINQVECEIQHCKSESIVNYHHSLRNEINKTGFKELNPYYILQEDNFSTSRICNIGEIIGPEGLNGLVPENGDHEELFPTGCQESENCHELKVLSNDPEDLKSEHSQHKALYNLHFHPNFSIFGGAVQDCGSRIAHPQSYQHQIRSSGLDKFTAVDRNGKRSILHEVETQAQLMPSIPGVYFDRRQIGYRVRYHNSYVGWVALSRHPSIKDAYEYAKQLWLKARNKSKMDKSQPEQTEVGIRDLGVRKRIRFGAYDENNQINQAIICKSGDTSENITCFETREIENDQIFQSKFFSSEYSSRDDEFGIQSIIGHGYSFRENALKQPLEQESSNELSKISQYSALETMRKMYFATQEYMEKWPSPDGYYTIHWSNTSDLSSYLFGEDCEQYHKRDFCKKIKNQRKVYITSENQNINLDNLNINKKQIESFNYIW